MPANRLTSDLPHAYSTVQQGFLLTRSSYDRKNSTVIEYWVATDQGPVRLLIEGERPVFFISAEFMQAARKALDPLQPQVELRGLELKQFNGTRAAGIYSPTISDHFTAQDLLQHQGIEIFESDFRLHDRFLMERFINGSVAFVGDYVQREGFMECRNCRIKPSDYRPSLTMLSVDIECDMDGTLYSVGLAGAGVMTETKVSEVLMIGQPESAENTLIEWFENEAALLIGLRDRINSIDPDLLIGWNFVNFDMQILLKRAVKHKISFYIGRDSRPPTWRDARGDVGKGYVSMAGRLAIDGIDALKSATWSFPSFSLEHVSQTLLSRGKKVEQDVDDRLAEIQHNFRYNKPALAAYNIEDCQLVLEIFDHTRIIEYLVLRCQITGLELDRAGGSVAAFTNLYLPRLHRGGYIAPNLPADGGLASPGGYVMDSKPGLYRNVLVLDFKSLYPSIIRTFKIDPMGLIEGLRNKVQSIPGFRGGCFHRSHHYLPQIITDLWQQRDQAKRDNDLPRSQAIKILMNSFYGVLGSSGCRFYDYRLASSITMRGHEIMQFTREWIEQQGYEVIYGDTDSTFVRLNQTFDQSQCIQIGNELTDLINQKWRNRLAEEFDLECFLEIEFETCFSRFLMPTIRGSEAGSKKRYAGLILDNRTGKDQIVFKGLENVRTDWTDLAKEFQLGLFQMVFHDQDPSDLIKRTVDETLAGERDQQLVYKKQLRRKLSAYVKNVPPHVRAARLADERNREQGKSLKYQNKGWISYIITTNGPEPVEHKVSPIDYDHYIDKQLKPVADAVLPFVNLDFDTLISAQAQLF